MSKTRNYFVKRMIVSPQKSGYHTVKSKAKNKSSCRGNFTLNYLEEYEDELESEELLDGYSDYPDIF